MELILSIWPYLGWPLFIALAVIWGFQAIFKSGKRETKVDATLLKRIDDLQEIIDDPTSSTLLLQGAMVARDALIRVRDANLTGQAKAIHTIGSGAAATAADIQTIVENAVNKALGKQPPQ